jgi:lincosamide nucleotidyltransferase A/C/D/E
VPGRLSTVRESMGADGTVLTEVLAVLDALSAAGCRFWLEGGWGVDALVGRQTRAHRDVDIDIDAAHEEVALAVLAELGYAVETDWRPNRVELTAAGRGWVDLHPLLIDEDGGARQAALGGGFHVFPGSFSTTGSLGGVPVPCVSAEAQRLFHTGYQQREVDAHDLALLEGLSPSTDPATTRRGIPGSSCGNAVGRL